MQDTFIIWKSLHSLLNSPDMFSGKTEIVNIVNTVKPLI